MYSGEPLRIHGDKGLELIQISQADAPTVYANLQDSYAHINDNDRGLFDAAPDLETFLECVENQNPDQLLFGMWHEDRVVGHMAIVGYFGTETGETTHYNIGYCVLKDEVRKGFASSALRASTDFLIDTVGAESVDALIELGNIPSAKTAQSAGLKFLEIELNGRLEECWRFGRERIWTPTKTAQFGVQVFDEVSYGDSKKSWIKLDGVDEERVVKSPTRLHVVGGILTVMQGDETTIVDQGDSVDIEPNQPYRMVGMATMYQIPARQAVAA